MAQATDLDARPGSALELSEAQLRVIAVKRGCRHYAPMAEGTDSGDPGAEALPHELLGCLLLAPEKPKADPFNDFRIGAMVLSDLGNDRKRARVAGRSHLLQLAAGDSLNRARAESVIGEVESAIERWQEFAGAAQVPGLQVAEVAGVLRRVLRESG